MEFKAGDIVRLKSSLLRMTVETVHDQNINCVWLSDGALSRANLPSVVLVSAPQDPREEIREWLGD